MSCVRMSVSAYGSGWRRENSFLSHHGTGAFCYGFYPHGNLAAQVLGYVNEISASQLKLLQRLRLVEETLTPETKIAEVARQVHSTRNREPARGGCEVRRRRQARPARMASAPRKR